MGTYFEESLLVAVIEQKTIQGIRDEVEKARAFTSCFELRLDALDEEELAHLPSLQLEGTWIYTFRHFEEGGRRVMSEGQRLERLKRALRCAPAFCDIEAMHSAGVEWLRAQFPKVRWIGSYHNWSCIPEDLDALLASMRRPFFDSYKIAIWAANLVDAIRLFAWAKRQKERLSVIALGPHGHPFRAIGPVFGNVFDYAAILSEKERLYRFDLKTMVERFGYGRLSRQTKLYALLGDPVEQSPGDLVHNRWFLEKNQNRVYVKLRVKKEELAAVFSALKNLPFEGFSITMPLKEVILPLLDELEEDAAAIGAVNTVFVREGKWWGANTDGVGAMRAIGKVKGRCISILGAGGASRAISYEAVKRGAFVTVYNRTPRSGVKDLNEGLKTSHDILVSTLPLSVQNELDFSCLKANGVLDAALSSQDTPLLCHLKEALRIPGMSMWEEQARLQQEIW